MTFSAEVVQQLSQPLDASRVAKRQGAGNMSLSYLEGYDVIDTANAIFGYDGWSSAVRSVVPGQYGYLATVAVMVGDTVREDSGYGIVQRDNGDGHEMAIKGAVTDALKRAFRTFGNQFGNSLYDKESPLHGQGNTPVRPNAGTNRVSAVGNAGRTNGVGSGPTQYGGGATGGISDKQIGFARKLATEAGLDLDTFVSDRFGKNPTALSKMEASALIDALNAEKGQTPQPARTAPQRTAPTDDVPF